MIEHYLRAGLRLIPIVSGSKRPALPGVTSNRLPQERREMLRQAGASHSDFSTNDPATIIHVLTANRLALGIEVGPVSNCVVLDWDPKAGETEAVSILRHYAPLLYPHSILRVNTPSGGKHLYVRTSAFTRTSVRRPGADFQARGAYCVAPPSPGYQADPSSPVLFDAAHLIPPAPVDLLTAVHNELSAVPMPATHGIGTTVATFPYLNPPPVIPAGFRDEAVFAASSLLAGRWPERPYVAYMLGVIWPRLEQPEHDPFTPELFAFKLQRGWATSTARLAAGPLVQWHQYLCDYQTLQDADPAGILPLLPEPGDPPIYATPTT